jgi:hypothetical protein
MNVFRDLYISVNAETMAAAIDEIEKALPAGWLRDKAAEARTQAFAPRRLRRSTERPQSRQSSASSSCRIW